SYARRLADSLNGLGVLRLESGQPAAALAACGRARDLLERLSSLSPPDPSDEFNLAVTHSNLGRAHAFEKRLEAAEGEYLKARDAFRRLAGRHPDEPKYQMELARNWYRLGALYQSGRRPDDARKAQAEALPTLERLVRDHPDVSSY